MFCKNCGKEVSDKAVVCPHCGVQIGVADINTHKSNYGTLAIIGFILAFVMPLAGLICSILGLKKCKEENLDGKNFAVAGIVISAVAIAGTILSVLFFVFVMIWTWGMITFPFIF